MNERQKKTHEKIGNRLAYLCAVTALGKGPLNIADKMARLTR